MELCKDNTYCKGHGTGKATGETEKGLWICGEERVFEGTETRSTCG